jgi:hypothetical protein
MRAAGATTEKHSGACAILRLMACLPAVEAAGGARAELGQVTVAEAVVA